MTFNIDDTTTDQSGNAGQPAGNPQGDNPSAGQQTGMTQEQIEAIVKRDEHAQQHILKIEGENKEMSDSLTKLSMEMEILKSKLASQEELKGLIEGKLSSAAHQPKAQDNVDNNNNSFDPSAIDELVSQKLQSYMSSQKEEANLNTAKQELNKIFSSKADDHVRDNAAKNGLSYEEAMDLAKKNPVLFNNLFVAPYKTGQSAASPTQQSFNSAAAPASSVVDKAYWTKKRKEMGAQFYTPAVQAEYAKWLLGNK